MSKKSFLLICALVLSSFAAACTTSTSGDPESLTTQAPATTETPSYYLPLNSQPKHPQQPKHP
ncbi:MAG TPA: hypothetical protein QF487_00965, partial [Acidimicrobiales bacterium]|nr:hypothetical protein [Acidimicrobiales bacterium]